VPKTQQQSTTSLYFRATQHREDDSERYVTNQWTQVIEESVEELAPPLTDEEWTKEVTAAIMNSSGALC